MKGFFLIAALVAAPSTNVLAGEVGVAQSGGDRFMLISESVKEYAERDGSRTALVYSYSGGERTLVTFMVDGCSQGYGAVAYGLAGEDYKKAVKTTWTAVGNKVFDRISYNILPADSDGSSVAATVATLSAAAGTRLLWQKVRPTVSDIQTPGPRSWRRIADPRHCAGRFRRRFG